MKEVVSLLEKHVRTNNIDKNRGLEVLLDYLIDLFDINHYINGTFESNISKQSLQSPYLFKIALIWFEKVAVAMDNGKCFDFFGGIYEEMYQSKSKAKGMGQFFTPYHVAELLSRIQLSDDKKFCADMGGCGSGRTLLAHYATHGFRDCYYRGDDLDVTSVKMAALNLMAHGMKGEVVQHDVLVNPILYDFGFEINEVRYPFPTPFFSLRLKAYTKEQLDKENEMVRKRYGDDVYVAQYSDYDVVRPKKGVKPKPLFKMKKDYKPFEQMELFV